MLDADPKTTKNLQEIRAAVAECQVDLEKLARTCCIAARSVRMKKLGHEVQALARIATVDISQEEISMDLIDSGVLQVEKVGGALGELYATCCTASREKLYISMFNSVYLVHRSLSRLKGVHH